MLERKIKGNSIGMFSFVKGAAMITIIMYHIWWNVLKYYPGTESPLWVRVLGNTNGCVMAVFFITSGYMFRDMAIKKSIRKHITQILCPYIWAGIASIVFAFIWYRFSGEPQWQTRLTAIAGGLLFGLGKTGSYFGIQIEGIYVFWFALALFNSSILLQLIMKLKNEKKIWAVLVCCAIAGMLLRFLPVRLPYCIPQALCFAIFLYIGFYWKKHNILFRNYHWTVYAGCLAGYSIGAVFGKTEMLDNIWRLWILEIPLTVMGAFLAIELCFFLFDNKALWMQPVIVIGRYSYWVMCIHAMDCLVSEWHQVFGQWFNNCYAEYIFMLIWRGGFIFVGCCIIKGLQKLRWQWVERAGRS